MKQKVGSQILKIDKNLLFTAEKGLIALCHVQNSFICVEFVIRGYSLNKNSIWLYLQFNCFLSQCFTNNFHDWDAFLYICVIGGFLIQSDSLYYSTARAIPRLPQRAVHFRSQRRSRFVFASSFCPISYFRHLRWASSYLDCGEDSPSIPIVFLRKTRFLRITRFPLGAPFSRLDLVSPLILVVEWWSLDIFALTK